MVEKLEKRGEDERERRRGINLPSIHNEATLDLSTIRFIDAPKTWNGATAESIAIHGKG